MRLTLACLLVLALIAGAACTQAAEAPPETTLPPTTPVTQAPPTTPPAATIPTQAEETTPPAAAEEAIAGEDIEAARQVVSAYWEAYNSYDVDGVLALLEDSWREERADAIAGEIGQMKTFGITLNAEEEAEPEVTADGTVAIKMKIATPLGDRHYTYRLKKINGEWKIYSAEE